MTRSPRRLTTLAALILPLPATAHPGHGQSGLAHWLTQADHLLMLGALVLTVPAALLIRAGMRRRTKRSSRG